MCVGQLLWLAAIGVTAVGHVQENYNSMSLQFGGTKEKHKKLF